MSGLHAGVAARDAKTSCPEFNRNEFENSNIGKRKRCGGPVKMSGLHAGVAARDAKKLHPKQPLCISDSKNCMSARQLPKYRLQILGMYSKSHLLVSIARRSLGSGSLFSAIASGVWPPEPGPSFHEKIKKAALVIWLFLSVLWVLYNNNILTKIVIFIVIITVIRALVSSEISRRRIPDLVLFVQQISVALI